MGSPSSSSVAPTFPRPPGRAGTCACRSPLSSRPPSTGCSRRCTRATRRASSCCTRSRRDMCHVAEHAEWYVRYIMRDARRHVHVHVACSACKRCRTRRTWHAAAGRRMQHVHVCACACHVEWHVHVACKRCRAHIVRGTLHAHADVRCGAHVLRIAWKRARTPRQPQPYPSP
jgi:hypothetical protein